MFALKIALVAAAALLVQAPAGSDAQAVVAAFACDENNPAAGPNATSKGNATLGQCSQDTDPDIGTYWLLATCSGDQYTVNVYNNSGCTGTPFAPQVTGDSCTCGNSSAGYASYAVNCEGTAPCGKKVAAFFCDENNQAAGPNATQKGTDAILGQCNFAADINAWTFPTCAGGKYSVSAYNNSDCTGTPLVNPPVTDVDSCTCAGDFALNCEGTFPCGTVTPGQAKTVLESPAGKAALAARIGLPILSITFPAPEAGELNVVITIDANFTTANLAQLRTTITNAIAAETGVQVSQIIGLALRSGSIIAEFTIVPLGTTGGATTGGEESGAATTGASVLMLAAGVAASLRC